MSRQMHHDKEGLARALENLRRAASANPELTPRGLYPRREVRGG